MSIFDLSKTPNSNTTIAGETAAEGMPPGGVNDVLRAFAADIKRWQEDMGAAITAGGSATAMTLITNSMVTALADGIQLGFVAANTNTGDATLAVDGLAPKAIRGNGDVALRAGNIVAGGHYTVAYDASANANAGAWILHNTSNDLDIVGITEETVPAKEDRVAFADASTTPPGLIRQSTWQNLLKVLGMLEASTDVAPTDRVPFTDTSSTPSGAARSATVLNFFKVINLFDELSAENISPEFDKVPIYDYSAGKVKWTLTTSLGGGNRKADFRPADMQPVGSPGDPDADPDPIPPEQTRPTLYESKRGSTNDIMVNGWMFLKEVDGDETVQKVQIRWAPPFSWDAGNLRIRLRWIPQRIEGTGTKVVWRARAMCLTDGDDVDKAFGTQELVTDTKLEDEDAEHMTDVFTITPADAEPNRAVIIEIARVGTDSDDTWSKGAILTLVEVSFVVTGG